MNLMKQLTASLLIAVLTATGLWGGEPLAEVRTTVDKILELLSDPEMDASPDEQQKRLVEVISEKFDFEKMTQLVVGRFRRKLSDEQFQRQTAATSNAPERSSTPSAAPPSAPVPPG